jgi:hypothetical protein
VKLDERSALPDDVVFPILSPDVDEDDNYDVIKEKRNTLNRTLGRVGKKIIKYGFATMKMASLVGTQN